MSSSLEERAGSPNPRRVSCTYVLRILPASGHVSSFLQQLCVCWVNITFFKKVNVVWTTCGCQKTAFRSGFDSVLLPSGPGDHMLSITALAPLPTESVNQVVGFLFACFLFFIFLFSLIYYCNFPSLRIPLQHVVAYSFTQSSIAYSIPSDYKAACQSQQNNM